MGGRGKAVPDSLRDQGVVWVDVYRRDVSGSRPWSVEAFDAAPWHLDARGRRRTFGSLEALQRHAERSASCRVGYRYMDGSDPAAPTDSGKGRGY